MIAAAPASALEACPNQPAKHVVYDGYGVIESVIVDSRGRLYFTDTANDRVMRANSPAAEPQELAGGIEAPGGMAFLPNGDLLVGTGDAIATGLFGNILPSAGLVRVDSDTGAKSGYASGLQMSNGVAIGPDGSVYASNDIGLIAGIDKVGSGGAPVDTHWAPVFSPNGLVVDSAGQNLFAAQTFQPAAIAKVNLGNPSQVNNFYSAPLADIAAGLDGMTSDENDQLYVAANLGGQIWRVSNPGASACSIAEGVSGASAVAFGEGPNGFSRENLYAVSFSGIVFEIEGMRSPAPTNPPDAAYAGLSAKAKPKKCKRFKRKVKRKRCKRKRSRRRR